MPEAQIAIVGGGIVGLAHACLAAKSGRTVVLFERHAAAQGASIRNFGMIWPIGQPPGERLQLALRSRGLWHSITEEAGLHVTSRGSMHLAYREDEAAVIREFAEVGPPQGYSCRWLSPAEVRAVAPGVRPQGLLGGLWSDSEMVVDPREVARALPAFLAERLGVCLRYASVVHAIEPPLVHTAQETWRVERVVVCGGDDFVTLYPDLFPQSGLQRCKLQMMRTAPQPGGWKLGAALAAGLTLRFYPSFRICRSLPALEQRIAAETPHFDRYGIHVMASQTPAGEVTIGDSHEYGDAITPFDKPQIDEWILSYLSGFLDLPSPAIAERWHGIYAKHPTQAYFLAEPHPSVRIVTGLGGAGMTLSFGLAEQTWNTWP